MKHKSWKGKARRLTAFLLGMVLLISQTSVTTLAKETAQTAPSCGKEEHTHTDACYEQKLLCGYGEENAPPQGENAEQEESDGASPESGDTAAAHVHTDACYESVLICGKEEHTHTDACYAAEDSANQATESKSSEVQSPSDQTEEEKQPEEESAEVKEAEDQADYLVKLPDGTTLEVEGGYATLTPSEAESLTDAASEESSAPRALLAKARKAAEITVPVAVDNGEEKNEKAGISADYLNFQCQTAWDAYRGGADLANNNLNSEGSTALTDKYGKTEIPAGHIKPNAPTNFTNPTTSARHDYAKATVKGVEVYQIGKLTIDGVEYVYYIPDETTDPSGLTVYSVLRADTKEPGFDLDNGDPNTDDTHITLWYTHTEGETVTYEFKDDAENPSGESLDSVFGDHRTVMTADDGSLDFQVTIPRGYQAQVEVTTTDIGYSVRQIHFNGEGNTSFPSLKMGVMRQYEDGEQLHPAASEGETDARTAVVTVPALEDTVLPLNVKVTLTKQEAPTFYPTWWLSQTDKSYFNFGGFDAANGTQMTNNAQPVTMTEDDKNPGAYTLPGNNHREKWTIRARSYYHDNTNITTITTYALSALEINGEKITVPMIEDPPAPYSDPGAGEEYKYKQTDKKETTLSTGTHITLTVNAEMVLTSNTTYNNMPVYIRTYTLEADNCMEDLTITDGSFIQNTQKKLEIVLENTSGEAWVHSDVYGHLYEYDAEQYSSAKWVDLDAAGGSMLDRTNSDTAFNWYSDPIRVKRQTGYAPPTVKVYGPDGTLLQEGDHLTDDGKAALGANNLAVELVRLANTVSDSSLTSNSSYTERIQRNDVKSRYPQYASYMDNGYVHHGFSDVIKNNTFRGGNSQISQDDRYSRHCTYDDWSQNPSAGGYYYLRGTQALDQYLLQKTENQLYSRIATIKISAEPLKVNVTYLNGADASGTNGPTADEIKGMTFNSAGEWTDTTGYNVKDNESLQIYSTPLYVEAGDGTNWYFDHWELVSVADRSKKPESTAEAVKGYTYDSGKYINVADVLEDETLVKNSYLTGTTQATFTLRAVWSKTPTTQSTSYTANYYVVDDEDQATKIASQTYEIPVSGKVQASLYNNDGSLNENVYKILQGTASGCTSEKDYTKGGEVRFSQHVCTASGEEKHNTTLSIDQVGPDNDVINIYLSEVDPVARFTVTKDWQNQPEGVSAQPVSVQLMQKAPNSQEWTEYGNPQQLALQDGVWTFTWNELPAYKDNDSTGGEENLYEYKVVELDGSGQKVESGSKTTINGVEYNVAYGTVSHTVLKQKETGEAANGRTLLYADDVDWSGSITNTYYDAGEYANLTIENSLRFANSGAPENDEFTVAINLTDESGTALTKDVKYAVYDTSSEKKPTEESDFDKTMSLTNGTGTVQLKAGEAVSLYDLKKDTKYTITENDKDFYTAAYKDREGKETAAVYWDDEKKEIGTKPYASAPLIGTILGGTDDTVKIINTYLGNVKVKKEVNSGIETDKQKLFDIHVALSPVRGEHITGTFKINAGGETKYVTFAQGSTGSETDRTTSIATVSLKDNESVIIYGLPAGVSYQVHEHLENTGFVAAAIYNTTPDTDPTADPTAMEKIQGGHFNNATITNTRQAANLEVALSVTSDLQSDLKKDFQFKCILKDEQGVQVGDATEFSLRNEDSEKIESLPAGYKYEIQAEGLDPDLYRITYSPSASGTLQSADNKVNITIERRTGNLLVDMTVTGDGADHAKLFTYTVKLEDESGKEVTGKFGDVEFKSGEGYTFRLNHSASRRLTGIPAGVTYTVTQEEAKNYTTTPGLTAKGAIQASELAQESFVNARGVSNLTIFKEVTGDPAPADDSFTFTVTLKDGQDNLTGSFAYTGANGAQSGTLTEDSKTITLKAGQSVTIAKIPAGASYTVKETAAANYTPYVGNDQKDTATGNITEGTAAEVKFSNKYTAPTGGLTISKTVTSSVGGVDANDIDKEFTFTVTLKGEKLADSYAYTGTSGKAGDTLTLADGDDSTKSGTITLKGGQSVTIQGLPPGTEYIITETPVNGYTTTYQVDGGDATIGNTATGTIKTQGAHTAAFTNDYTGGTPQTLNVTKKWDDGNDQDGSRPGTITVNVMRAVEGAAAGSETVAESIDLGKTATDKDGNWIGTVEQLPSYDTNGKKLTYHVKEKGESDGSITFQQGNGDYTYQVTYDEDGRTITNTYEPKKVDVTVQKAWANTDGKGGTTAPAGASVTVQLYKGGSPVEDSKVTLDGNVDGTETTAWQYTWKDLPEYENGAKITYTVKELHGDSGVDEGGTIVIGGNDYVVTYDEATTPGITTITNTMEANISYQVKYYQDSVDQANLKGTDTVTGAWVGQKIILQAGAGNGQLDHYRPTGYVSGVQKGTVPYTITGNNDVIQVVYEPFGKPYKQVAVNDGTPADNTLAYAGDTLTYTITWKNETQAAQKITITDVLPANTTLVDGSITQSVGVSEGIYDEGSKTITWTGDSVAIGAEVTVSFEVTIDGNGAVKPTDTIENKAAVSWQTATGTTESEESEKVVTTITKDYDVTFDQGDHGSIDGADADGSKTEIVQHGQYVQTVPEPVPGEGYTFIGWHKDGDDSGKLYGEGDIKTIPVTEDMKFTAQYEQITYNVTFDVGEYGAWADGGTTDKNMTIPHGSTVTDEGNTVPEVDANDDYRFTGWLGSDGKTYTSEQIAELPIKDSMTFTAQYEEIPKYTLHYESNGGTTYNDEVYRDGTKVELDKVPVRDGYTFTGWYADKELENRITSVEMDTDTTVYAGWKAKEEKPVTPSEPDAVKPDHPGGGQGTTGGAQTSNQKSAGKAVQTGDQAPIGLWTALILASGAAASGTAIYRRKKKK